MSSLYKMYKTDAKKEQEGALIEFPANEEGELKGKKPVFRIAHMSQSNPIYAKELERASRPYKRQLELDQLPIETDRAVTLDVFLSVILLGWENVQGEDDKELPYNVTNARKLMNDLPKLYDELRTNAVRFSIYRADQLEKDAKN